jgi:hypothetical protein
MARRPGKGQACDPERISQRRSRAQNSARLDRNGVFVDSAHLDNIIMVDINAGGHFVLARDSKKYVDRQRTQKRLVVFAHAFFIPNSERFVFARAPMRDFKHATRHDFNSGFDILTSSAKGGLHIFG